MKEIRIMETLILMGGITERENDDWRPIIYFKYIDQLECWVTYHYYLDKVNLILLPDHKDIINKNIIPIYNSKYHHILYSYYWWIVSIYFHSY